MFCLKIYYEDWNKFNDYTRNIINQWLNESCSDAVASCLEDRVTTAGTT
jgi:hypothetical protein